MWGRGEGGRIIASFSELIGRESMEGNQEAADKRWQRRLLEREPIDAKTHTAADGETHTRVGKRKSEKEKKKHTHTPRDTNTDKQSHKDIETDTRMTPTQSQIRRHKDRPGPHHTLSTAGRDNGRKT